MAIVRVKKRVTPYVVIDKTVLEDERLSFKARGLAAYLLSKPDNWTVNERQLIKSGPDGQAAIRSGLHELEQAGYLKRERMHTGEGKFTWETTLYESPCLENPRMDNPRMEKPIVENPRMDNPLVISNEVISNEGNKEVTPPPISSDPYMDAAQRKWDRKQNGLPVSNQHGQMQIAEWNLEMPAKPRRLLAEAIATATGKLALWNAGDDKLHVQLHEAAIKAHKMGYTPDRVARLTDAWRDNWRAKGGGSVGQYLEFLSEQTTEAPKRQRRPRLAPMEAA